MEADALNPLKSLQRVSIFFMALPQVPSPIIRRVAADQCWRVASEREAMVTPRYGQEATTHRPKEDAAMAKSHCVSRSDGTKAVSIPQAQSTE